MAVKCEVGCCSNTSVIGMPMIKGGRKFVCGRCMDALAYSTHPFHCVVLGCAKDPTEHICIKAGMQMIGICNHHIESELDFYSYLLNRTKNIPTIVERLVGVPAKPLIKICIYGGCLHHASCSFYGRYPFLCFTHKFANMKENRYLNRFRQKMLRVKRFETNLRRRKLRATGSNEEYKRHIDSKADKRNKKIGLTKELKSIGWRRIRMLLRLATH